jgi:dCTP deaminase
MILSDDGIKKAISNGQLVISPIPTEDQYTTSAVDLFLGKGFQGWDQSRFQVKGAKVELNLAEQNFASTAEGYLKNLKPQSDGSFVIPPYHLYPMPILAMTREKVHLKQGSKLAARVEGRSSFARLGLLIHLTAPIIHANFNAAITLEIINLGPFHLRLVPGSTRICQLVIERLESDPEGDIRTQFQHQTSPRGKGKPKK